MQRTRLHQSHNRPTRYPRKIAPVHALWKKHALVRAVVIRLHATWTLSTRTHGRLVQPQCHRRRQEGRGREQQPAQPALVGEWRGPRLQMSTTHVDNGCAACAPVERPLDVDSDARSTKRSICRDAGSARLLVEPNVPVRSETWRARRRGRRPAAPRRPRCARLSGLSPQQRPRL